MNEKIMRKHYETTPKEILIDILVSARVEFDKLQGRNKEYKQEIARLNNIINESIKFVKTEYNTYPSAEEWRTALIDILRGDKKWKN